MCSAPNLESRTFEEIAVSPTQFDAKLLTTDYMHMYMHLHVSVTSCVSVNTAGSVGSLEFTRAKLRKKAFYFTDSSKLTHWSYKFSHMTSCHGKLYTVPARTSA